MKRIMALLTAVAVLFTANALLVIVASLGVMALLIFWVQMAGLLN